MAAQASIGHGHHVGPVSAECSDGIGGDVLVSQEPDVGRCDQGAGAKLSRPMVAAAKRMAARTSSRGGFS
jgi:hypothetical protein